MIKSILMIFAVIIVGSVLFVLSLHMAEKNFGYQGQIGVIAAFILAPFCWKIKL